MAWVLPWLDGRAAIGFCLEQARAIAWVEKACGADVGLFAVLEEIRSSPLPRSFTSLYETVQLLTRVLRATPEWPSACVEWLATGSMCAQAWLANSSGGGQLYGSLLEQTGSRLGCSPEGTDDRLLKARERDAFGSPGQRQGNVEGFRIAWRAGRYRTAYAIAACR